MNSDATLSSWKQTFGPWLVRAAVMLATALLGALAHWLGADPKTVTIEKEVHVPTPASPPAPPPVPPEYAPTFGWHADTDAITLNRDPAKTLHFDATPAGRAALGDGDAFLWRHVRKAAGHDPPWYPNVNQQSVKCYSFITSISPELLGVSQEKAVRGAE